MSTLIVTAISGWALVLAIAATIALPYLLRRRALGAAERRPVLERLRPHYWLGYAIAGGALVHAAVPAVAGWGLRANGTGLYLATGALLLVILQMFWGLLLREPSVRDRAAVRRRHFWGMVGLVALALGHIALNSALIHGL